MKHEAPRQRVILGRNPVLEALRARTTISRVVLLKTTGGKGIQEIRAIARTRGIPVEERGKDQFSQIAGDGNAQGVIALSPEQRTLTLDELIALSLGRNEPGFIILPDQIEDPGNLGALIRTAECAGAHGLVLTRHHSASLSTGTIKAAAGATEYLPVAEVANLVNTITELKKHGFWIAGLDMAGDRLYTQMDYSAPIAIVIGSEGKGMRRLVKEQCDFLVRIPLSGKISSLNASVAGGLVMFEVRRQRSFHQV